MKKVIACVAVLTLLVSLFVPVMAAEAEFTPSVTNKPAPEIVPVEDPDGKPAIGVIRDASGDIISYVYEDCLVVTAVADAETSTLIPDASEALLLEVYEKLTNGEMEIPYEKHDADLDASKMVIRDLYDATWLCGDHPEMVAPEGVVLEIVFDLGINAGVDVYAMTYKNNEWNPIVKSDNNGDGTVTCTFEDLCPVEFSVSTASTTPPEQTGDIFEYHWIIIAAVALAAIVALTVVYVVDSKKRASR